MLDLSDIRFVTWKEEIHSCQRSAYKFGAVFKDKKFDINKVAKSLRKIEKNLWPPEFREEFGEVC